MWLSGANGQRTGTMKVWNWREVKRRKERWSESGRGALEERNIFKSEAGGTPAQADKQTAPTSSCLLKPKQ